MNKQKTVLISGIAGQAGSYLAEHCLSKGEIVHGIVRSSMTNNYSNLKNIYDKVKLFQGDLTDYNFVKSIDYDSYDNIYHLAAQSHVGLSFSIPDYTRKINYDSTLWLLDSYFSKNPNGKFHFAATSELFGDSPAPQNEDTLMNPLSPYAQAKKDALNACQVFRKHGKFVSSSISFNHESPRRGKQFVTQKIIYAIKSYKSNKDNNVLILGNLDSLCDWGYAKDYVEAYYDIINHSIPDDFVVATNISYSIKDFIIKSLNIANIKKYKIIENIKIDNKEYSDLEYLEEIKNNKECFYVLQSKDFYRPNEVNSLQGDYSKINKELQWQPKTNLDELIKLMLT